MKINAIIPPVPTAVLLLAAIAITWAGCSKKIPSAQVIDPSPSGQLSRYDMLFNDYDVLPVTTFDLSYNAANQVTDIYEKSGQNLIFYSCTYTGSKLSQTTDNNLGVQSYSYDSLGRIARIDYTTPLVVGKRIFTWNAAGQLASVFDSVTNPPSFPVMYQYLYTYDAAGSNVIQITQNTLNLAEVPTLNQETFYTYDSKQNPFSGFPPLLDARQLPGDLPALFNKNNVLTTYRVGTVPKTSGGGSVPTLDTINIYNSVRTYQYNGKDYPATCQESFQDLQYNYSGNRSFTFYY